MAILVTGGAGYIGSHTCLELLEEGYEVVVVDNLSNASRESLKRVEGLTGKKLKFYEADILDAEALDTLFTEETIDSVIHFAGLKAVGESVEVPMAYYKNNIVGTTVLCEIMQKHNVKNIVFSSSATVYGLPHATPIKEDFPLSATNPYGRTKLMLEEILGDLYVSDKDWNIIVLRYFNPIGAHKSGQIGEDPRGIPNNLMPYITQVAVGKRPFLGVFGDDYDTIDGTGVRDYIHVVDLAKGHVCALKKITQQPGFKTYNLGTGTGYSVLQTVATFEAASGRPITYKILPRRAGDIGECFADATKAREEMGWSAMYALEDMCQDAWRWQSENPEGYNVR